MSRPWVPPQKGKGKEVRKKERGEKRGREGRTVFATEEGQGQCGRPC